VSRSPVRPARDVSPALGSHDLIPSCRTCQVPVQVRPVHITGVQKGVQYWRCDECGFVWAPIYGKDRKSGMLAEDKPRAKTRATLSQT
jgi:hypothetical protein